MHDRYRANVCGLVLLLLWLSGPALAGEQSPAADDWTETGGRWETQSYWQDPGILQRYTFSANTDDKVVGQSSVEVHMEVGVERPNNLIELRLVPPQPLDLSKAEAIEVWLRQTAGERLVPRDCFLCNPGFEKLTIVAWPERLELVPGGPWQRAVLDLTEARVLDKAKPAVDGQYDRHDVATICLNFTLPEGRAVDARLQIDGLAVAKLPPPAVQAEKQADGSYVFTTARYRAVIGANGYLQSLRAGPTEFFQPYSLPGPEGQSLPKTAPPTASACYLENDPSKGLVPLDTLTLKGRTRLEAQGKQATIKYAFREDDFDIAPQAGLCPGGAVVVCLVAGGRCRAGRTHRPSFARDRTGRGRPDRHAPRDADGCRAGLPTASGRLLADVAGKPAGRRLGLPASGLRSGVVQADAAAHPGAGRAGGDRFSGGVLQSRFSPAGREAGPLRRHGYELRAGASLRPFHVPSVRLPDAHACRRTRHAVCPGTGPGTRRAHGCGVEPAGALSRHRSSSRTTRGVSDRSSGCSRTISPTTVRP